jgi:xylan 1,4-beta-xylosidase
MFSRLESQQVVVENSARRELAQLMKPEARATTDVDALATRGDGSLSIILWHHHDDGGSGPSLPIRLLVDRLPSQTQKARLRHWRIDERHSNAFTAWKAMGSPQNPTPSQLRELKRASELTLLEPSRTIDVMQGRIEVRFHLPRHAVSLVKLEWETGRE